MPIPFVIFGIVCVVGLISIAFFVFRRRDRKLPIENGLQPIYSAICGGRTYNMGLVLSYPLVRCTLYPEFMVVTLLPTQVIQYSTVSRVERKATWAFPLAPLLVEYKNEEGTKWVAEIGFKSNDDADRIAELISEKMGVAREDSE
jgi:hypothetical protein